MNYTHRSIVCPMGICCKMRLCNIIVHKLQVFNKSTAYFNSQPITFTSTCKFAYRLLTTYPINYRSSALYTIYFTIYIPIELNFTFREISLLRLSAYSHSITSSFSNSISQLLSLDLLVSIAHYRIGLHLAMSHTYSIYY